MILKPNRYLVWAVLLCVLYVGNLSGQRKVWIYFTNNDTSPYKINIPVNPKYTEYITNVTGNIEFESRWFNAVVVKTSERKINKLKELPFVLSVVPVQKFKTGIHSGNPVDTLPIDEKVILFKQLSLLGGNEFISRNIDGKGIRIAVFDGGFSGVVKSPLFRHLFENNRIIKTYDFVKKKEFVYGYMTHGTKVLSCIAGIYNNKPLGLATGAEFLLARTEIKPERYIEEHNWVAAMEWAYENGADIINCSLGYTSKLYPIDAMDGQTSIVAKAANIAAKKGMLVINSIGNNGNDKWEIMGTPADADSVLSVGGINPFTGFHIPFSSFGPTIDKRLKPNVTAPAIVMAWSGKGIDKTSGTSFSAPIISGFAACVWQMNKDSTNMQIFRMIQKSGHLYPYFDYAHGYGIPHAANYFQNNATNMVAPITLAISENSIKVIINNLNITETNPEDFLYYHIEDTKGFLRYYAVIKVQQVEVFSLDTNLLEPNEKVRFYFKKYVQEYTKK